MLSIFHIAVQQFTREQLITSFGKKEYSIRIQDKQKKDIIHVKHFSKPVIKVGILEQLLLFLAGKGDFPKAIEPCRVKGQGTSRVKWFILDLSEGNAVCQEIFWFFVQSFSSNEYVMVDGLHLATDFHYHQQKLMRNHTHKIILLLNEKFLQDYKKDLPPIPVFNQS